MSDKHAPIAIFDSGLGGLTVLSRLQEHLPNESYIYFGDTARNPYGTKSADLIKSIANQNATYLMRYKPKLMVLACNTASAVALPYLQEKLQIPVVGVIAPGAKKAAELTKTRRVGVIGTQGTIDSEVYKQSILDCASDITIYQRACPLLVSIVEEGRSCEDKIVFAVVKDYLVDFLAKNIDALVLGCTHYPVLKPVIAQFLGPRVSIVDSAIETALVVQDLLTANGTLKPAGAVYCRVLASDNPEHFMKVAASFADAHIDSIDFVDVADLYASD